MSVITRTGKTIVSKVKYEKTNLSGYGYFSSFGPVVLAGPWVAPTCGMPIKDINEHYLRTPFFIKNFNYRLITANNKCLDKTSCPVL